MRRKEERYVSEAENSDTAYVLIRQHTSAYVSIRQVVSMRRKKERYVSEAENSDTAYVPIRPHTSAYVSIR
jgi:hypothetical protein